MLTHACNIIIGRNVISPGHGKEVFDGLNAIDIFSINVNGQGSIGCLKVLQQSGEN